jgi:hypothetical protein
MWIIHSSKEQDQKMVAINGSERYLSYCSIAVTMFAEKV